MTKSEQAALTHQEDWGKLTAEEQGRFDAKMASEDAANIEVALATADYMAETLGVEKLLELADEFRAFVEARHGQLWVLVATIEEARAEVDTFVAQQSAPLAKGEAWC